MIEYGVQIEPQFGYTWEMIRETAHAAEAAGFESLWASDHFLIRPGAVDVNCLEAWTVLTAVACETKRLRVGAMVASQSYRNPVLHAKIAASLDHMSGGRVYFGIGAGWKAVEYKAYGMPFPRPGKRVRQLEEAIIIAKKLWAEPKADYQGRYYNVNDCVSMPKPVQDPLPVLVGGMGTRLLKVSARHANTVNFAWNTPLDTYKERLGVLAKHCDEVGRDYDSIRKSAGLNLALEGVESGTVAPYMKYTGERKWEYKTPEEAAEFIRGYADLGVDHFVIVFPYASEPESVGFFMEHVSPLV
jgi:probable F420-dependent oxidoreductase